MAWAPRIRPLASVEAAITGSQIRKLAAALQSRWKRRQRQRQARAARPAAAKRGCGISSSGLVRGSSIQPIPPHPVMASAPLWRAVCR